MIPSHSARAFQALVCTVLLAACASAHHDEPTAQEPPRLIGGQRDAHGCLTPGDFSWCARENRCVQPWELAAEKKFENSRAGFDAWCNAKDAPTAP